MFVSLAEMSSKHFLPLRSQMRPGCCGNTDRQDAQDSIECARFSSAAEAVVLVLS